MQLPTNIGRFRIDALLGRGGMGEVYRAFDPTLQRTVALKTVRRGTERADSLERLYREAQACARLQHAHIVTVHEAGELDGLVYIAMELLPGESFDVVLARGELTFQTKLEIVNQILGAVAHAHASGVIHRDIKPSNVQLLPDGSIKLLDFGLARLASATALTMTGTVMGTLHYCAPEQLRGDAVDHRSDIFSTGAMTYEMLAGRRPFSADDESAAAVLAKVLSEDPRAIDSVWTRRFPEIEAIVLRAMAKSPDERYPTALAMRDAIAAFLTAHRDRIAETQRELDTADGRTIVSPKRFAAAAASAPPSSLLPTPAAVPARPAALHATQAVWAQGQGGEAAPEAVSSSGRRIPVLVAAAVGTILVLTIMAWAWWPGGAPAATIDDQRASLGSPTAAPSAPATSRPAATAAPSSSSDLTAGSPQVSASGGDAKTAGATLPPRGQSPISDGTTPSQPRDTTASRRQPEPADAGSGGTPVPAVAGGAKADAGGSGSPSEPPSAKRLFGAAGAVDGVNPGLRYRLIQQLGNEERDVDPETTFRSGDKVKFAFDANIDGYLYVVYQASSGKWDLLFPNPEVNGGRNAITRGREYLVPDDAFWEFDGNPGEERLFVILSREPLPSLPGFNRAVTAADTTVAAATVAQLEQSIRPRDLFLQKDRSSGPNSKPSQATYVVNRDQLGAAVTATIVLKHGK